MADFKLQVFTQEKKVLDEAVSSITVPGREGYLGVWAHHAPLVAILGKGRLTVKGGSGEAVHRISGGFIEVHDNVATLLVDSFD